MLLLLPSPAGMSFYWFKPAGAGSCSLNVALITLTLLLLVIFSSLSLLPLARQVGEVCGLGAAVVVEATNMPTISHSPPLLTGHDSPLLTGHDSPLLTGHDSPPFTGHDSPPLTGHDCMFDIWCTPLASSKKTGPLIFCKLLLVLMSPLPRHAGTDAGVLSRPPSPACCMLMLSTHALFTPLPPPPPPQGSIFPAAVVSLYVAYLSFSALQSEPRDYECNSFGAQVGTWGGGERGRWARGGEGGGAGGHRGVQVGSTGRRAEALESFREVGVLSR